MKFFCYTIIINRYFTKIKIRSYRNVSLDLHFTLSVVNQFETGICSEAVACSVCCSLVGRRCFDSVQRFAFKVGENVQIRVVRANVSRPQFRHHHDAKCGPVDFAKTLSDGRCDHDGYFAFP